jgi:cAMP-dependent protein kinase regulator
MLSSLDSYERLNVADALVSRVFESGQCIIQEGDPADGMYFIEDGEVKVTIKKSGHETDVKKMSKGMYFGEMALVENSPRSASVYACSQKTKVAFLERESFERLLGPCMDIMKRTMTTYQRSS